MKRGRKPGFKMPIDQKNRMINKLTGRKLSDTHKQNISAARNRYERSKGGAV
jgi:hypothetical protein